MMQAGSLPSFNGQPVVLSNDRRLVNVTQVEIDCGPVPVDQFETIVADPGISMTSRIFATMSWEQPNGKDADDVPMDSYVVNVNNGVGSLTLRLRSLDGRVHDRYRINYIVG